MQAGTQGQVGDARKRATARGDRVPPHDLDAEACCLSVVLLRPEELDTMRGILRAPLYFYADAHRWIYEAALTLWEKGIKVDLVSVATWLREQDRLAAVGGTPYLAQITDAVPYVLAWEQHARTVREKWRLRQALSLCQVKAAEVYAGVSQDDAQIWFETLENAVAELGEISHETDLEAISSIFERYIEALRKARERGGSVIGTPTLLGSLDKLTGGLFDGDLIVAAGRPGIGKTSFASSIALAVAKQKIGVAFFSLEMPRDQITMRFACSEQKLDANRVRRNEIKEEEWKRLVAAAPALQALPIWVDDSSAITVAELRAKVRKLRRLIQNGKAGVECERLGLVVVDYLQLMRGERQKGDTREREVASVSAGLKDLAKRVSVPVLALSQLNRSLEQRGQKDKRPKLSDLRESGSIENDADSVWLLYRESYYDRQANNEVEIDVAKQRNGPTDTVRVVFDRSSMRYYDAETRDEYSDLFNRPDKYTEGSTDGLDDV